MAGFSNSWFRPRRTRSGRLLKARPEALPWTHQVARAIKEGRAVETQQIGEGDDGGQIGNVGDGCGICPPARDCGNCRWAPRVWERDMRDPSRCGECRRPDEMFAPVVTEVCGRHWIAGRIVRNCDGWRETV